MQREKVTREMKSKECSRKGQAKILQKRTHTIIASNIVREQLISNLDKEKFVKATHVDMEI